LFYGKRIFEAFALVGLVTNKRLHLWIAVKNFKFKKPITIQIAYQSSLLFYSINFELEERFGI